MSYNSWFQQHGEKHQAILKKLTHLSSEEIIAYFRFENMLKHEPDFCPLYKEQKKCHDIPKLNCYLCACPHFRFNDEGLTEMYGKKLYSTCSINSKEGKRFIDDTAMHQDCSNCTIPHHESYIRTIFQRDWFEMMASVPPSED